MVSTKCAFESLKWNPLYSFPPVFAEVPRAVPRQQNDTHFTGFPGGQLSHHHVHLLLALQLQRCRDQVHAHVWPKVTNNNNNNQQACRFSLGRPFDMLLLNVFVLAYDDNCLAYPAGVWRKIDCRCQVKFT